jgi:putative sigma-54 modulation protein
MQLDITGRHVEITPPIRQLIQKRLKKIERLLNDSAVSGRVILTKEKYRHRTEILIHARGDHRMRGLGEGNNWSVSAREAANKVEEQAHKLKAKWTEVKRTLARRQATKSIDGEAQPAAAAAPRMRVAVRQAHGDPEQRRRVVRARRYPLKPMSIDDAVLRVDDGAETFFVFRNAETDAISILYRRKDGNLGLIEPE